MGNLRDRYTNEEWDEISSKIEEDKKEGETKRYIINFINLE